MSGKIESCIYANLDTAFSSGSIPCKFAERDLPLGKSFNLKCFFQTDSARAAQPMVYLARAHRGAQKLPEGRHRDSVLLKVFAQDH